MSEEPISASRWGWPAVLAAHVAAIGAWYAGSIYVTGYAHPDPFIPSGGRYLAIQGPLYWLVVALASVGVVLFACRSRFFRPATIAFFASVICAELASPIETLLFGSEHIRAFVTRDVVVIGLCIVQLAAWGIYVSRSRRLAATMHR